MKNFILLLGVISVVATCTCETHPPASRESHPFQVFAFCGGESANLLAKAEIPKTDASAKEFDNPLNWTARGGCWDFSKKIIQGRGLGSRPIAYFRQRDYADFLYEIRLRLLADEDGSYGILVRFDEKKDSGYIFGIYPHGDFEFTQIEDGAARGIAGGPAIYLNDQLKTWNKLKIICQGNKFELYLNDQLLIKTEDDQFKIGKIGLYLGHGPMSTVQYEIINLIPR